MLNLLCFGSFVKGQHVDGCFSLIVLRNISLLSVQLRFATDLLCLRSTSERKSLSSGFFVSHQLIQLHELRLIIQPSV